MVSDFLDELRCTDSAKFTYGCALDAFVWCFKCESTVMVVDNVKELEAYSTLDKFVSWLLPRLCE